VSRVALRASLAIGAYRGIGIEQSYSYRVTITTLSDLEPAARDPAEKLVRLLTGYEPTGEEPLMAIFEWALERLSAPGKQPKQR
jgi:hypothetical protein